MKKIGWFLMGYVAVGAVILGAIGAGEFALWCVDHMRPEWALFTILTAIFGTVVGAYMAQDEVP